MQAWLPVPGTTTGRLVEAALGLFGELGYAGVGVTEIAERAGVTTGSLYHHFGSKAALYALVRTDVEQRVLDRLEGAASVRAGEGGVDLAAVLIVGFDYLVRSGYARLLAETLPEQSDPAAPDRIEQLITRVAGSDGTPLGTLVAAAWRAALWHASTTPDAQGARAALEQLLSPRA